MKGVEGVWNKGKWRDVGGDKLIMVDVFVKCHVVYLLFSHIFFVLNIITSNVNHI